MLRRANDARQEDVAIGLPGAVSGLTDHCCSPAFGKWRTPIIMLNMQRGAALIVPYTSQSRITLRWPKMKTSLSKVRPVSCSSSSSTTAPASLAA
ncbi:MAG: hypothetical protein [Caudoviricetes sp.]|nr:MAG: hypothetical protein [Caudoviricetes sp.]